jgi:hypothetical protein
VKKLKSKKVEISESEIYAEIEKIVSVKRFNHKKFIFNQKQIDFINKVRGGKNMLTWSEAAQYWNKLFGDELSQSALKGRVLTNKHLFKI